MGYENLEVWGYENLKYGVWGYENPLSLQFQDPGSELHYTDVRQLHQMMVAEINTLRGVGASAQRHSLLEVKKIVHFFENFVWLWSKFYNFVGLKSKFFSAFFQSLQCVCVCVFGSFLH